MPTDSVAKHTDTDGSTERDEILKQINAYILDVVRRKIPRAIVPGAVLDLEIDEIAQHTRIKLWQAMQRGHISNIRSYIKSIVYTETIDLIRKHKPVVSLPLDEYGELYQEHILATLSQSSLDPVEQFEQAETYYHLMIRLAQAVRALPPRQRYAMICALKDYSIDDDMLIKIFALCGLDIASTHWPKEPRELQSLRTSLSIARKKLHELKDVA